MNFSPNSISLPRLSRDGLRIQPAGEILHHLPLADRSRSDRRDREHKVRDLRGSIRRDSGPPYIEIRETARQPEILALQDLPQTRTLTVHSHPAHLRPI